MDTPPTILPREIRYEWSPEISRAAAQRYFSRRFRQPLIVFSAFCVLFILGLVFAPHGDPAMSCLALFGLGFCLSPLLFLAGTYFRMTKSFERLPDNQVRVRIEPECIIFETSESVSTLKWSAIKQLWKFPDVLLLFRYKTAMAFLALPVAPLGADVSRAIEDKIRQHGGRIV